MATRTVYVVDDEEPIRGALRMMLRVQGYSVTLFSSGPAFLETVESLVPGCLLLDVRMPDMDGIEVQRHLIARQASLPVVVMTGHGDLAVAVSALQHGAAAFVEKPFAKAVLKRALERAFLQLENPDAFRADVEASAGRVAGLGEAEREVLARLAAGRSNEAIAADLATSVSVVEVRRARLFAALGVESVNEALTIAFDAGLGRPGD